MRSPLVERANAQLEPLTERRLLEHGAGEPAKLVLVVGVPRSGTTLATQILARGLGCDYVDHVMASFWKAPEVGYAMSQIAFGRDKHAHIGFDSELGRTRDPRDVHHYGYFWREVLGTDARGYRVADPKWGLLDTLLGGCGAGPWVMQGQHPMLYADEVEDAVGADNILWVRVDRERRATIESIARANDAGVPLIQYGSYDHIRDHLDTHFRHDNVFAIDYEDVCRPKSFVREVADRLAVPVAHRFTEHFTSR